MADNELRLFTDTLAEQLLHSAKAGGVQNDLRTMLVCDEANKVVDPDTDHVLNRTVREARKYGHGLVLASQQINDFSDDILANVGTTIILGVADYYQEGLRKRLGLASELFSRIVLQKTGLVQYRRRFLARHRHLTSSWDDLCMGWPFAEEAVDALHNHITDALTTKVRNREEPVLQLALRRGLAIYWVTARRERLALTHTPFRLFIAILVETIAVRLSDVGVVLPTADVWTVQSEKALSTIGTKVKQCPRISIHSDVITSIDHLTKLAVQPRYRPLLEAANRSP